VSAHDDLQAALVAALDAGEPIPCRGPRRRWWTSEAADDRDTAVTRCAPCPILDACHAAAESTRERFGVWAGRDRGPARKASR